MLVVEKASILNSLLLAKGACVWMLFALLQYLVLMFRVLSDVCVMLCNLIAAST